MAFEFQLLLRVLQIGLSFIVLELSSQVAYWQFDFASLLTQMYFLISISCISILFALYLEVAPVLLEVAPSLPRKAFHPYVMFGIEAAISLLYMAGFMALILPAKLRFCNGIVCVAARVNALSVALNFVSWTASTMVVGWEISKLHQKQEEALLVEKRVEMGEETRRREN